MKLQAKNTTIKTTIGVMIIIRNNGEPDMIYVKNGKAKVTDTTGDKASCRHGLHPSVFYGSLYESGESGDTEEFIRAWE